MNKKNIIVILVCFIIIVILTDLIFNFSGNLMENFNSMQIDNFKSVISKLDGKIFNIVYKDRGNQIIYIPSPNSDVNNIALQSDGSLVELPKNSNNIKQQWKLIRISNMSELNRELSSRENGIRTANFTNTNPFYIIKSLDPEKRNWCLQFDYGKLISRPFGNYNSQKWDVSNQAVNYKGNICAAHCNSVSNYGNSPLQMGIEDSDPNKIKINLNLKDEYLKKLFSGIASEDNSVSNSVEAGNNNNDNSKYVHKSALKSLCKGCEV